MKPHLAAIARRHGVKRKSIILSPIRPRKTLEAELNRIALRSIRAMEAMKPRLLEAAAQARSELYQDGVVLEAVLWAWRKLTGSLADKARDMVRRLFTIEEVKHSKKWIDQLNNAIGVDLAGIVASENVRPVVDLAVSTAVALIKGITDELAKQVEVTIMQGVTQGKSNAQIAAALDQNFKFGKKRSALIARDQAAKFNAALNRTRQQQAGVTTYIWWTMQDERVRGNPDGKYASAKPSHWDRHGLKFTYAKPPEGGHPGTEIQCRCIARPVLEL